MPSTESYNLFIDEERNVYKNVIYLHTGLSLSHVTGPAQSIVSASFCFCKLML